MHLTHIVCRFQIVPYSNTLLLSPEEIAVDLRKFYEEKNPEQWVLIESVLDIVEFNEWHGHWDAFFESGLYKVCIDMLTDDASYTEDIPEVRLVKLILLMPLLTTAPAETSRPYRDPAAAPCSPSLEPIRSKGSRRQVAVTRAG